jgi:transketolase
MLGWDIETYAKRAEAFGWKAVVVQDGHDFDQILAAFEKMHTLQTTTPAKPFFILARTIKGKGVSFMENKIEWHGVAPKPEQCEQAIQELNT